MRFVASMWWLALALVGLAVAIPLGIWAVSALWVRIITRRWDAMCADEEPPRAP